MPEPARTSARLTVSIERPAPEPATPEEPLAPPVDDPPVEMADTNIVVEPPRATEPQLAVAEEPDPPQRVNLQAIADEAIRKSLDRHAVDSALQAHQWRESWSIMFEPGEDPLVLVDESFLEDFRFKPEVHVVGLGLTIGSCFFGIPLVGVPVEQRSVALRLVVCASDPG